jgi:PAS domain-containing protein
VAWERAATLRIDGEGHWLDATSEALDLLGVPSIDVLRDLPADAFAAVPADPSEQAAFAEAYFATESRSLLIEGPYRRLDGEVGRARTAVVPDPDGAYHLLILPLERPTTDLSTRVLTIAEVLAEWRGAERRLVTLDPESEDAKRVAEEIEGLREVHGRLFREASAGR